MAKREQLSQKLSAAQAEEAAKVKTARFQVAPPLHSSCLHRPPSACGHCSLLNSGVSHVSDAHGMRMQARLTCLGRKMRPLLTSQV